MTGGVAPVPEPDPTARWAAARDRAIAVLRKARDEAAHAEILADLEAAATEARCRRSAERGVPEADWTGWTRAGEIANRRNSHARAAADLAELELALKLVAAGTAGVIRSLFPDWPEPDGAEP